MKNLESFLTSSLTIQEMIDLAAALGSKNKLTYRLHNPGQATYAELMVFEKFLNTPALDLYLDFGLGRGTLTDEQVQLIEKNSHAH